MCLRVMGPLMVPIPLFSVILDRTSSPRLPSTRPADLVVRHHLQKFAGDEARAEHVVDAEGLGRRGGRRGGVVHSVWELLLQLQIVQNEPVAVVGYAEAVRGLAVGGSSEVGADPGGQTRRPSRGSGPGLSRVSRDGKVTSRGTLCTEPSS